MARVYKVSFYLTDYNEEFHNDVDLLKMKIQETVEGMWIGVSHLKLNESEKFEWDDELKINMIDSTEEDFEKYFKNN